MIKIEHFFTESSGAIRCVYSDGREDWMVDPFRNSNPRAAHVLNDERFLVIGQKSLRLYDSQRQICIGSLEIPENAQVVASPNGHHFVVLYRLNQTHSSLSVFRAADLIQAAHIKDCSSHALNSAYERHDGTVIVGARSPRFHGNCYILSFSRDSASIEAADDFTCPYSHGRNAWPDPTRRKLATVSGRISTEPVKGSASTYGLEIEIWNLDDTNTPQRFMLERLPLHLHNNYLGFDNYPSGHLNRECWNDYVEAMTFAADQSFVSQSYEGLDKETARMHSRAISAKIDFLRDNLVDMSWEADGQAIWALFSTGFLRRIDMNGALSPRFVIERAATPPALNNKRCNKPFSSERPRAERITCLTDGSLRIDFRKAVGASISHIHLNPRELTAKRSRLQKFFPMNLLGISKDFVVRQADEAPASDALPVPSLPSAFKVMPDASDPRVTEPLPHDPVRDIDLKERKRAFERQQIEAEVPLRSLAPDDCISALEYLAKAIRTRFGELRCGAWFRPVFVLQSREDDKPGLRLGEDDFCAHLVEQVPEAVPALEAVIHAFVDEAPKHEIPNSMLFTGLDEENPALARIVEALVRLDPTRYAVLERYIRALYVEHDGYVKYYVAPLFGEVNGWRDIEAVRFGILWTLLQWCGGAGGYVCLWNDYGMSTEVQLRMPAEKFLGLFLHEVQTHLNRTDEDQYPNSVAWNKSALADFLTACRSELFVGPDEYNQKIRSGIDEFLGRKVK